jgi:hypothetical protein
MKTRFHENFIMITLQFDGFIIGEKYVQTNSLYFNKIAISDLIQFNSLDPFFLADLSFKLIEKIKKKQCQIIKTF